MKIKNLPVTQYTPPTEGKLNIGGASFNTVAMRGMKKQEIKDAYPELSEEDHATLWAAVSKGEMPAEDPQL